MAPEIVSLKCQFVAVQTFSVFEELKGAHKNRNGWMESTKAISLKGCSLNIR